MTPLAVAGVWLGAGSLGAIALPAFRLRRLAVLVPLAALVALLLASAPPGTSLPAAATLSPLVLDRTTQGLLMATAISLALLLILAPSADPRDLLTLGFVGAATVVAVTATDPVTWGLAWLLAAAVLALRWISAAPGRPTLAAGRVGVGAAAVLLAVAPFLPVIGVPTGPRPVLVAALLVCGLGALLGLVPLGGWATSAMTGLRGPQVAGWPLLLAPAVLLSAQRIQLELPPLGASTFNRIVLALGLITAVWSGIQAARAAEPRRYSRVYVADLGLAAAAIGSSHLGLAQSGGLFLVLTHLVVAPLLMQEGAGPAPARRLAWLLLCGIPPAPSFWGRFLLLRALAQVSPQTLTFTLLTMGLLFLTAVLATRAAAQPGDTRRVTGAGGLAAAATGWLVVAAGVALGLVSQAGATFIFGSG